VLEGRAAIGYDRGHDAGEVFYLGPALDEGYVEGFVEGCPERIGEDDPNEEEFLRGVWEEGDDLRGFVPEALKGGVEVRAGRPRTSRGRGGLHGVDPRRALQKIPFAQK
jgi:hypothetical protein